MSTGFNVAALATMVAVSVFANVGCAAPATAKKKAATTPDHAVVVDFYTDSKVTSACSGTLVSPNVVLTAAHCAEGSTSARVQAPATGKKALVKTIYGYDWKWRGSTDQHVDEHDLALVVLRTPLKASKYATLESTDCTGCKITRVTRLRTKKTIQTKVSTSSPMKIGKDHPQTRPNDLYVPRGTVDAGGALLRMDTKGRGHVVGVMIGTGGLSHGGYAARIDEENTQKWVRGIVYAHRLKKSGSVTTKALHLRDEGDEGYADESSYEESAPAESESESESTADYESTDDDSSPSTETNPYEENEEPAAEEPVDEPAEEAETPSEEEEVTQGGRTDNPGEIDEDTDTSEDTEEEKPAREDDREEPDTVGLLPPEGAQPERVVPVDTTVPTDPYAKAGPLAEGIDGKGISSTNTDNASINFHTETPSDRAIKEMVETYASDNKDVNVISTHGAPNWMEAAPSDARIKELGSNGKPIVMAVCNASAEDFDGRTNAMRVAETAGIPPEKVYGCSGNVAPETFRMRCNGTWTDANGTPLDRDTRAIHGLANCTGQYFQCSSD